jgi:ribonuclease III
VKLEYVFSNQALCRQALSHKSAGAENNERLEFLGDAILNWVIAEAVYLKFPHASEGEMSRLRAQLVRQESLADIARTLKIGEHLILGSGELKSGGYRRDSILSDALEALVAAIYLDSESMDACQRVVLAWFAGKLEKLSLDEESRDNKTLLQEWLQSRALSLPVYEVVEETGPDNARLFKVRCAIPTPRQSAVAEGGSKKQAEQKSAALVLAKLQDTLQQQKEKP